MGQDSSEIRREIETTRARMGDTVEALGYKADVPSRVKDAVNDRVETVKGTIGDAISGVAGTVQSATHRAGDALGGGLPDRGAIGEAARRGVGIAQENPLGLAIGAAAIGFLAGLLAPVTDYERKTIGPIRDDLLQRAQEIGSDALQHGKDVIAETAQAALYGAQQSAQNHAQQIASETLQPNAAGPASP
jgi:hypothetical protein